MAPGRVPTFGTGFRWIPDGGTRRQWYHTAYLDEYYNFGFPMEKKFGSARSRNGHFPQSEKHRFFLKGALRAVGGMAFVAAAPGRNEHMPAAVHVKAVADSALRCTGFSLLRVRQQCCEHISSAAGAAAG